VYVIFDAINLPVLLEKMPCVLVEIYRLLQETYRTLFSSVDKLHPCGRSVRVYQITRRHITEDSILQSLRPEKPKIRIAEMMSGRRKRK
jgi:hypothetical protein